MKNKSIFCIILLFFLMQIPFISAEETEDEDLEIFGLEVEKTIQLFFSGILALALSILTYLAYKKSNKNKLRIIALAFFLYSIKTFLLSSELFIEEIAIMVQSVKLNFLNFFKYVPWFN